MRLNRSVRWKQRLLYSWMRNAFVRTCCRYSQNKSMATGCPFVGFSKLSFHRSGNTFDVKVD